MFICACVLSGGSLRGLGLAAHPPQNNGSSQNLVAKDTGPTPYACMYLQIEKLKSVVEKKWTEYLNKTKDNNYPQGLRDGTYHSDSLSSIASTSHPPSLVLNR